jgi:hypothetical protein
LGKPWLARLPRLQRRINPFWAGGNQHMGMWTVADLWERETLTSLGIPKQQRVCKDHALEPEGSLAEQGRI